MGSRPKWYSDPKYTDPEYPTFYPPGLLERRLPTVAVGCKLFRRASYVDSLWTTASSTLLRRSRYRRWLVDATSIPDSMPDRTSDDLDSCPPSKGHDC